MYNYDFLVVNSYYYLQYILEPNIIIYYIDIKDKQLKCTDYLDAVCYVSYDNAVMIQKKIKEMFGLEFQIVKVV